MDLTRTTAAALIAQMDAGAVSAEEVTRAYLDRADRLNGRLNVFLHQDADRALDQARAVDTRRKAGEPLGPLAGVPIAIKDNFCTLG
jgi:aspartyl-tRNA(Asn)/glutamyl-tRNA(Gln) amidotransferase subunit A